MRVLVIGGTRFVGYQLVWRLMAAGHTVTILNRGLQGDPFGDRVERLLADRATDTFPKVLNDRRFDAAVDFAAYDGDHARGAVAALGNGKVGHYIFISSGQVYLVTSNYQPPAAEEDYDGDLVPEPSEDYDRRQWLYGVRKREAENVLASAWARDGFPSTRLRLPMVNGERDPSLRVDSYLWRILDGGPILLPDGGHQETRHIYSGDVVRAIMRLMCSATMFGEAYNLSQDCALSLSEFVRSLAEAVGAPARLVGMPSESLREAGIDPFGISPFSTPWMSVIDATKARSEIQFRPESPSTYLDKIVTTFLAHPPDQPPENYRHRPTELALARDALNK